MDSLSSKHMWGRSRYRPRTLPSSLKKSRSCGSAGAAWCAPERPGTRSERGRGGRRAPSLHGPRSRPRAAERSGRRSVCSGRLAVTVRLEQAYLALEIPSLRSPVLPLGRLAGPAPRSPLLHPRQLSGSSCRRCPLPGPPRRAQESPHPRPQPGPAPPGPAGLRRPGPRSRRGSCPAPHPAPPSLRRAGLSAGPPSVFLLPPPHLLPKSCYF